MNISRSLRLQSISDYRTELMGIAILCVVFYHMKIDLNELPYLSPLSTIKAISYGGVDLFFFLSGFGIVCGWLRKKYCISEFYKKRLVRVVPTYWLWMVLNGFLSLIVFEDFKIKGFIADFFGIGFLLSKSYGNWFIPAIIVCYLIFPFIASFFLRKSDDHLIFRNLFFMIAYASVPCMVISLTLILTHANQLLIFSSRLPNFILGILVGLACFKYKAQTLKDLHISTCLLVSLVVMGLTTLYLAIVFNTEAVNFKYGFLWYPFILLAFPLCLLLANGIAWFDRVFSEVIPFSVVGRFLRFCGTYSLEIYLMHTLFFGKSSLMLNNLLDSSELLVLLNRGRILSYIFLVTASIITAYLLNHAVRFISYLVKKNLSSI